MKDFDRKKGPRRRDSGRFGRRDYERSSKRDSGRFGRKSEPVIMHKVTCDKCGKECEVPFKPTPGKPVYCDECFKKDRNSGSNKSNFSEKFDQINEKLDRILEAIEKN